jgi:serine protease Do
MKHPKSFLAGAGVALLLALGLYVGLPGRTTWAADHGATTPDHVATMLSDAYRHVAAELRPSVVSIESVKIEKPMQGPTLQEFPDGNNMPGMDGFPGSGLLRRFFGGGMTPAPAMKQVGLGTGVVVSADGNILTNNHVVKGADKVTVRLWNDRELKATVVGTDPQTDLAVVHVDAKDLTPATLGDSSEVEPGDLCVAMGSPFGLNETLTTGIVSAKGRARIGIAAYENFIQTDAAINPGNSGGPLADVHGNVIGINTAIFSRTGGSNGIGFAIPINMAKNVMHQILANGKVVRGYLGVKIQDLTAGLAKSFGDTNTTGSLVSQVLPATPAQKAGLEDGDIITAVDGNPVADSLALRNRIAAVAPGKEANLTVLRDGKTMTIPVTVGELGAETAPAPATREKSSWDKLGLTVKPLTDDAARHINVPAGTTGVLVTAVQPGSIADDAGLMAGDVIVGVQGQAVTNQAEFQKELTKHPLTDGIRLKVMRNSGTVYLFLEQKTD